MKGERVAPPLTPVDGLTITVNSREVQLTTNFGLTVRFDGNSRGGKKKKEETSVQALIWHLYESDNFPLLFLSFCVLEIILPSTYKTFVGGLCGNYDGITRNEYMKPDGTMAKDLNEFGESWRVTDGRSDRLRISNLPVNAHRYDHNQGHCFTCEYILYKLKKLLRKKVCSGCVIKENCLMF